MYWTNLVYKLLIIALALNFLSCKQNETERVVSQTHQDGSPKIVQYFSQVDGIKTLIKEEGFYENKIKQFEGGYKNGHKNGTWKTWYDTGKLWSVTAFIDDVNDGPTVSYHPNGKKYYEGQYVNGRKSGLWKFWDENGILIKEMILK